MIDPSRERWEKLRRLLLAFVAMVRESDPGGRYTVDIRVVEREQVTRRSA